MDTIYLDHAATTPVHPEVFQAMKPYMKEVFGNPSSIHHYGRQSRRAIEQSREICARTLSAKTQEIVFTSGGTEADNLAIIGAALAYREKGRHIVTTKIEHHAVLNTCEYLEDIGFDVTYLPVDENGFLTAEDVEKSLREDTILVTIMYGNNEVGTLLPIAEIGAMLKEKDVLFHTDAVQAYGIHDIDVKRLGVDLLSVSGHKINGPKGSGFLYVADHVRLIPRQYGGEQERKRRAGTENVSAIVGLGQAAMLAQQTRDERLRSYEKMRETMLSIFTEKGIDFAVNGPLTGGLPHVLNVFFPGTNVESLLVNLDLAGICASSGSACTAGSHEPSHVLAAMFGNDKRGRASVRFSFGLHNSLEQVEEAAIRTAEIVKRIRGGES